ncbi:hypothetical protein [Desulfovibrio litoralis]|uniref:Uncharacterized protein n=1 Tax=Desulfovibrio litoralis DSM 11393 TaxID=1121455 RepID=A0A1M7T7S2_9BACT|nr:hypothetical protein [Desulfovibrio litoralis]SHN66785.1 hypothetical protein SAMN02745728_01692 [Desulfovibrio litoralis DSM 11393]
MTKPKQTKTATAKKRRPKAQENEEAKVLSYADVVRLAKEQAIPAINALTNALTSLKVSDRINAAKELLDRGYGKTNQKLELSGEIKQDLSVNPEALELIDKLYSNKTKKK